VPEAELTAPPASMRHRKRRRDAGREEEEGHWPRGRGGGASVTEGRSGRAVWPAGGGRGRVARR
jgi:hypothetical protein